MAFLCGHCGSRHQAVSEARECARRTPGSTASSPHSVADVLDLVDKKAAVPFDHLLDAIAICRGEGENHLLDVCIDLALKSVTGEVPEWKWRPVVKEAASRLIANTDFDQLRATAVRGSQELRSRLTVYQDGSVREVMQNEAETLDELAVLLADNEPPSLVSACSRLRKLNRPDLGRIAATRAIDMDSGIAPARTTRAAAVLDAGRPEQAIDDLEWLEANEPSSYSANVWSRAEQMRGHPDRAVAWARTANERDPEGVAGMLSLAKAASLTGDHETTEWAFRSWQDKHGSTGLSPHYPAFIAAKDLYAAGHRSRALETLQQLAAVGYEPARRLLLEYAA